MAEQRTGLVIQTNLDRLCHYDLSGIALTSKIHVLSSWHLIVIGQDSYNHNDNVTT